MVSEAVRRNGSALRITLTDDSDIAAAPISGVSVTWKTGQSAPAAMGIAAALYAKASVRF